MSTYTKSVRKALHLIQKSIDGSINFIDAGSGKGKVLIIAYQEGIKNIIGVELDHAIHNLSKRNLGSLGIDKVVKLYNTDILNFDDYPKQGTNVMFMYNPFGWGNSKFVRMSNP
jgi:predicted RNA methylase